MCFPGARAVLTSISRVVDGLIRLDEDVSRVKGHHEHSLLRVEVLKVHLQIHKLVPLLLAIQTARGKLGSKIHTQQAGYNHTKQETM